ncbi:hypothetical protein EYC84_008523 [Monilinia fructicola]|uniref:Uncharacterized protein n=1 Tax=Monilinia fructicola TaxID=38448 RepID=A0A5M9JFM9_MONFR|nr:hypothetical protein EYC84_008523 [Monilinia fructicola]
MAQLYRTGFRRGHMQDTLTYARRLMIADLFPLCSGIVVHDISNSHNSQTSFLSVIIYFSSLLSFTLHNSILLAILTFGMNWNGAGSKNETLIPIQCLFERQAWCLSFDVYLYHQVSWYYFFPCFLPFTTYFSRFTFQSISFPIC